MKTMTPPTSRMMTTTADYCRHVATTQYTNTISQYTIQYICTVLRFSLKLFPLISQVENEKTKKEKVSNVSGLGLVAGRNQTAEWTWLFYKTLLPPQVRLLMKIFQASPLIVCTDREPGMDCPLPIVFNLLGRNDSAIFFISPSLHLFLSLN